MSQNQLQQQCAELVAQTEKIYTFLEQQNTEFESKIWNLFQLNESIEVIMKSIEQHVSTHDDASLFASRLVQHLKMCRVNS
jgi:hypothetical protein